MDGGFFKDKIMRWRQHKKFIHEGDYVAEVDIELIESDEGWSPYLSMEEAKKLDIV